MQDGCGAREDSPAQDAGKAGDDDPVIAFLFAQANGGDPAARPANAGSSRTHFRLSNNRGALYLPTHTETGNRGGMVEQW